MKKTDPNFQLTKKRVDDCHWFHQTAKRNVEAILKDGFVVEEGGNQRFTEGVYFLSHSGASYGDTTLQACINGNFLRIRNFPFDDWETVKSAYHDKLKTENKPFNFTTLTQRMHQDYPDADGVVFVENGDQPEEFAHMLVAWKPKKSISKTSLIKSPP